MFLQKIHVVLEKSSILKKGEKVDYYSDIRGSVEADYPGLHLGYMSNIYTHSY